MAQIVIDVERFFRIEYGESGGCRTVEGKLNSNGLCHEVMEQMQNRLPPASGGWDGGGFTLSRLKEDTK